MTLSRYSHVSRQQDDLGQRLSPLRFNEAAPACHRQARTPRILSGRRAPQGVESVTASRGGLVFAGGGLAGRQGDDQQPA